MRKDESARHPLIDSSSLNASFPFLDFFEGDQERVEFEVAALQRSPRGIRLRDDRRNEPLPFDTTAVPWSESGRWLSDPTIRPASFLEYAAGNYYIQDAGSLLPISLLDPQPGEWICDLCAAPGGKGSAILERMDGKGLLVANEAIRSRVDSLRSMLARTGQMNYIVANKDPEELVELLAGSFDAVLVDAPCSGQMLLGKEKRDANAWSETQVAHSAKRQNRILDAAIRLVKPGGRLVYSTCTFAVEENEAQVQRVVHNNPNEWTYLKRESLQNWRSPAQSGCYRLWPHRDGCAGGFAGGIVREDHGDENVSISGRKVKRKGSKVSKRAHPKEEREALKYLEEFGACGEGVELRLWGNEVSLGTEGMWSLLERVPELGAGPTAMVSKGSRWLPFHTLALLRRSCFVTRQTASLSDELAKSYLTGEPIPELSNAQTSEVDKASSGWHVMEWKHHPLGWAKHAGLRWNNHLPTWATQMRLEG